MPFSFQDNCPGAREMAAWPYTLMAISSVDLDHLTWQSKTVTFLLGCHPEVEGFLPKQKNPEVMHSMTFPASFKASSLSQQYIESIWAWPPVAIASLPVFSPGCPSRRVLRWCPLLLTLVTSWLSMPSLPRHPFPQVVKFYRQGKRVHHKLGFCWQFIPKQLWPTSLFLETM